ILTPNGSDVTAQNAVAFTIAGLRDPGTTIEISVTDGVTTVTATNTAVTGAWSNIMDLSSLEDGTLTVTVTATDAAGNTATDTIELDKDAIAEMLALSSDESENSDFDEDEEWLLDLE